MSGKTYVGNGSNKATKPTKIYIGNSSNKAAAVKKIYVGNGSNKAVQVWPMNVIPDTNYQQILYFGYKENSRYGGIALPSSLLIRNNPRVEITFTLVDYPDHYLLFGNDAYSGYGSFGFTVTTRSSTGAGAYFGKDCFCFEYGNRTNTTYSGRPAFIGTTLNSGEGLLLDKLYRIDFNHISNGTSYFYLYCSTGYYSISSHNLIGSIATNSFSVPGTYDRLGILNIIDEVSGSGSTPKFLNWAGGVRLYSCKIYNSSNSLLFNLYPSRRISDDMVGLYDIVNRVFYSSNNTYSDGYMDVGPDYEGEL